MNIQKPINILKKESSTVINASKKKDMIVITDLLYGIKKDFKSVQNYLEKNCNEYATNAFKYENYVMIPAEEELSREIERIALKLDIFGSKSTLRLKDKIELDDKANIYVFAAGDGKLTKYDKKVVTDSAKTDFYQEMKKLIESGKIDKNEILNDKLWYMTEDGKKIYNLSPNITGNIPYSDQQNTEKKLFDILFNQK